MVNTKNRSTPVVEKRAEKTCDCGCKDCTCDGNCNCACAKMKKMLLLCGTVLVSSALIAGAIFLKPEGPKYAQLSPAQMKALISQNARSIQTYIRRHPKLIIDSVEKYFQSEDKKKIKAEAFDLNKFEKADPELVQQIVNDKTNYSLGNPNGKFVIIEFFDHQCGWCKKTNAGLSAAVASEAGKNIRWIPIDTPIFGDASEMIARYVLAAGEQGKYAEMHKAVGSDQTELNAARVRTNATVKEYVEKNKLDPNVQADLDKVMAYSQEVSAKEYGAALANIGKTVGLDTKKLATAAESEKIKGKLKSNEEFRKKLKIRGVPMMIIDGRKKPGALFGDALDTVVELSSK